jgi:putative thiamine transport system permease protein
MVVAALALLVLPLWAFAKRWRFPDALPAKWSLDKFNASTDLLTQLSTTTLLIAFSAAFIALIISVLILEHKRLFSGKVFWFDRFIYIPILLPQVGFLFGLQIALIWSHLNGSLAGVILLHTLYCLPYVYLTLQGPYLKFQQGYYTQALALTQRPLYAFVQVKLAMLKGPLLNAAALAVAVSIAQYLPTLVAGEGRINTLTTEAVALAASGERKQASLMALLQAFMPLLVFIMAHFIAKHWTSWRLAIYYRAIDKNNISAK